MVCNDSVVREGKEIERGISSSSISVLDRSKWVRVSLTLKTIGPISPLGNVGTFIIKSSERFGRNVMAEEREVQGFDARLR